MLRSAGMFRSNEASSMVVLSRAKCPNGSRLSSTRTILCFAGEQRKLHSSCSASVSLKKKELEIARFIKQKGFPRKDSTTTVLKCLREERGPVIFGCGLNDEGPLSRNEVVELLSQAVDTLLKPENQNRLRDRLEKYKQTESECLEQPADVDQWNSPEPTDSPQNLGEVRFSEMASDAIDSGRCSADQASSMSKNVTVPITLETAELVEIDGRPIEAMESSTVSVEGKDEKSLTSIRSLKVLDVHSYVHNALRESALRSWLRSRTISG